MKKIIIAVIALLLSYVAIADTIPKTRGLRIMGCREQVMRISESACQFKYAVLPTEDTLPDKLEVLAVDDVPVDVCLRKWEEVVKKCRRAD